MYVGIELTAISESHKVNTCLMTNKYNGSAAVLLRTDHSMDL